MFSNDDKNVLRKIAKDSIQFGLIHRKPMPIEKQNYSVNLQSDGASFVTLKLNNELRGCIGSIEAYQPLVEDVARNAYAAAFDDPRFYPLITEEFSKLKIEISILSKMEEIEFSSEEDLIKKLRPNIDGLLLEEKQYRGTFLPAVWESLKEPRQFLQQLKLKAGLPSGYWSDTLQVFRYTAEKI